MAKLLRRKSNLVIAFGSCAHLGGIPGLANLTSRDEIFRTSYMDSPTVHNPSRTEPQTRSTTPGIEVTLPAIWDQVHALDQVVEVDYYLPGCPPMPHTIGDAVSAILSGNLPDKGAVLAPEKALCDSCERRKTRDPKLRISKIYRPHQVELDPERCFLEQGVICCGPATRGGCGEACISGNMPCTGCYGPPPGITDQGAKLLTAIASLFEAKNKEEAETLAAQVVDPAGTFYRYGVPASTLARRLEEGESK